MKSSTEWQFETERLILRPFTEADIPSLSAYRSDPAVARFQDWHAPYPISKATDLVNHMQQIQFGQSDQWLQIAIELTSTHQHIGDCALHVFDHDRQAEFGITLAQGFQKQGFAFEAISKLVSICFDTLKVHRISATCDVNNLASANLLEKLGLRREAHFVENIHFKGSWGSEFVYACLASEWQS